MNNVSIKGVQGDVERNIKLNNGNLLLHIANGVVIESFIVTSFRNPNSYHGNGRFKSNTAQYCSLVNLDTGTLAFEEPCSRSTTEKRVLNHLLSAGYLNGAKWETDLSIISGHTLKVFNGGNYKIELSLGEEQFNGGGK